MIHHVDSISLLSVLIDRDRKKNGSRRYMLNKLSDTAYSVEKQKKDILFDLDDSALRRLCIISEQTVIVNNQSVFVPNMQETILIKVIKKHKPSKEISDLILKYHV